MQPVVAHDPPEERPVTVGWVHRVTGWIDRSPLPGPLWYAALGVVAVGLFVLSDGLLASRPQDAALPFHVVLALGPIYALGLMHLLDVRADRALGRMRSVLRMPEALPVLRSQLITLPARPLRWASGGGLLVGAVAVLIGRLALPAVFRPFLLEGGSRIFVEAWLVLNWFVFGALFLHTFHQLRVINQIYTRHVIIDLDNYQPLFHFSTVSALTAIGLLVIPYAWYMAVPNLVREPAGVVFGALFPVFALLSFLWPLVGVHNLLVEAKTQGLAENARVLQAGRAVLYARVAASEFEHAGDLHDGLAAVRAEREALLAIPTWPWQPGTPRSVAAALLLPLAIWLLQWLLGRVLGA